MATLSKKAWMTIAACILIAVCILSVIMFGAMNDKTHSPEAVVTFETQQGNITFECEVADTDAERSTGLMNRESLGSDAGMLFVFDEPQNVTFWMKNTLIPLDMIFIAENGTVVNIEEAVPEPGVADGSLARYSSAAPVKWVLEVNMGICSENGIVPGTSVTIAYPEVPV